MKSLNVEDLKGLVAWLAQRILGSQLQDAWTDGEIVALELRGKGQSQWLCLDLQMPAPRVTYFEQKPKLQKTPKPATTFMRAHALNLRLTEIQVLEQQGRVVEILFSSSGEQHCRLEVILIPKMANLLITTAEKKIAWSKPRELPAPMAPDPGWVSRDWEKEAVTYFSESSNSEIETDKTKSNDRALQKKLKAVQELQASLAADTESQWRELGELLKWSKEVPNHLQGLYDSKLTVSENRERAFKKAKDTGHKKAGTMARISVLENEILKLQLPSGSSEASSTATTTANKILQKSGSRARKLALEDGLQAALGSSAKDNLAILRQARAWDYWLHLRDYPSAHAIIFRNKGQNVSDLQFQRVAQWLISESIEKKKPQNGAKYDVVLAECRHVRPVKGSTGTVTYQQSRTFTVSSKAR